MGLGLRWRGGGCERRGGSRSRAGNEGDGEREGLRLCFFLLAQGFTADLLPSHPSPRRRTKSDPPSPKGLVLNEDRKPLGESP